MGGKTTMNERVSEDMAEFMLYGAEMPEIHERVQEFLRAHDGRDPAGDGRHRTGVAAARLAPSTRARVRRFRPGRGARVACAALGSAIFASMAVGSLAILGAPYAYIFAAGTAALAVILPVRELRGNV